ncbi:Nucleotidylyl transferase [Biscogniauxia marginata]|nr:Nucleotidylyl transferase [Biscogniauxia marginata]
MSSSTAPHAEDPDMSRLPESLVPLFTQALKSYSLSNASFRVLCSLPSSATPARDGGDNNNNDADILTPRPPRRPPRSIIVLDSSFNPPTLAHQRMALSALADPNYFPSAPPREEEKSRVLLLLAINNADKAPKPVAFPQRLAMMYMFARDLLSASPSSSPVPVPAPAQVQDSTIVDIAVTTEPYFHAKSGAIASADFYRGTGTGISETTTTTTTATTATTVAAAEEEGQRSQEETEQVYLTGFDTLIRIFDPKYYRPHYPDGGGGGSASPMRTALDPLFARARLRVTPRPDAEWGDAEAQRRYLAELRGRLGQGQQQLGGRSEWADRVDMVEGAEDGEGEAEAVSSTRVRDAARRRDWGALGRLVSPGVAAWIREEGPYVPGEEAG